MLSTSTSAFSVQSHKLESTDSMIGRMLGAIVTCASLALTTAGTLLTVTESAKAYDSAHLLQLQTTGVCVNCDLSNADLTSGSVTKIIDVSGSNLKSAIVSDRNDLAGTNFQGADLSSANFSKSVGTGANFKNAVADGADFRQSSFVNSKADGSSFVNAVLDDADFTSGYFYKANLTGASFQGTLAISADFTQANITDADFSYSNISKANFQYASGIANSQYSGSFYQTGVTPPPPPSLTDCTTGSQVKFNNTTAERANFSHVISEEFLGFNLKAPGANFSSVSLCTAKVVRADLENANFVGAQINLNNINNQGLIATQANLSGAKFIEAYLLKADMTKANLTNAVFEKTNLGGAKLGGAILAGVSWVHAYLKDVNLSGAQDASDSALSWADYLMGITLPDSTKPQFCDAPTVLTSETGAWSGGWSDHTGFGFSHNYSNCQVEIIAPEGLFGVHISFDYLGSPSQMIGVYAKDDLQFQNNLVANIDRTRPKDLFIEKGAIIKFFTDFYPENIGVKLTYNLLPPDPTGCRYPSASPTPTIPPIPPVKEPSSRLSDIQQLQLTGVCKNCDLSNADLTSLSLFPKILDVSGSNLAGAILVGRKDLNGTNFSLASLVNADFSNTQANEASFTGADLTGAKFVGATTVGANFNKSKIIDVDFSYSNISSAQFKSTSSSSFQEPRGSAECICGICPTSPPQEPRCLPNSSKPKSVLKLDHATIKNTDFSELIADEVLGFSADLSGSNFSSSSICTAKLSRANLTNSNFSNTKINPGEFSDQGLLAQQANLTGSNFTNASLPLAQFQGTVLNPTNLTNVKMEGTKLEGANLSYTNLAGVSWVHANLKDANLQNSLNLDDRALSWANYLIGITLPNATKPQFCNAPKTLTGETGIWSDRTGFDFSHNFSDCQVEIAPEGNFDFINILLESLGLMEPLGLPSRMIKVYAKDDLQNNLLNGIDLITSKELTIKNGAIIKFLTGFDPENSGVKLTYNTGQTSPSLPVVFKSPSLPVVVDSPSSPVVVNSPSSPVRVNSPSSPVRVNSPSSPVRVNSPSSPVVVNSTSSPTEKSTIVPEPTGMLGLVGLVLARWLRRKQGDRPNP